MGHRSDIHSSRGGLNRFIYRLIRGAPFRTQTDVVSVKEWLLRRVPSGKAEYFDVAKELPLQRIAFRPSPEDTDGISLFREMFISAPALARTGRKPPYHVMRLLAADIAAAGLSIVPKPDEIPGHVVLPELFFKQKPAPDEKKRSTEYQIALREAAHPVFIAVRVGQADS